LGVGCICHWAEVPRQTIAIAITKIDFLINITILFSFSTTDFTDYLDYILIITAYAADCCA